jgi:hypothetical protein
MRGARTYVMVLGGVGEKGSITSSVGRQPERPEQWLK